jgi:sugar/nucleoside kinase (ribokinase family)
LGRLGVESGVVGVVGDDAFGRFCIDDFRQHNVDTSRLLVDREGSTVFCICISDEETQGRSLVGRRAPLRKLTLEDIDREYVTQGKFLHLDSVTPETRQAAIWARESGVRVSIDADHYQQATAQNYGLLDVFIASEFYYKGAFQDDRYEANCRSIVEQGPEIVIFTFGERGCLGVYDNTYFTCPAFPVNAVDTTGAGDVFHGAFLYGLLQGWDVEFTAKYASAVSAIKCTRVGGRAGIPDRHTVEHFLRDGVIETSDIDQRVVYYRDRLFKMQS